MNHKIKKTYNQGLITRDLLASTVITLYLGFGAFMILAVKGIYSMYSFQANDFPYRAAAFFKDNFLLIAAIYIFCGCGGILYLFFKRPYQQVEEIMQAAKDAYDTNKESRELSPELREFALDLEELKLKIQQNERAAKEAEQRKNDLIVYLAHDLKTPLTSVIGYLSLLKDEREISKELQEKYIDISLEKSERLEDLINEFFEITRFNLTTLTLERSRINLTRMLEQLIFEFQPMFAEKNLKARLECPPDLMMDCDVDKMQRVFDNLLRNAVNYSYPDTEIEVAVKEGEQGLHMEFLNHGQTIIPEKLSRIFEQFYRLDSSRSTKSGGAGLGLAIAKEIVELHGGTIRAESENETVVFYLDFSDY